MSLNPIFLGGTLVLDQAGATYSQPFTLDTSTTNTIDQAGSSATRSRACSDATPAGGNIVFANSGSGGAVVPATNTYTGTTTINSSATLIVDVDRNVVTDHGEQRRHARWRKERSAKLVAGAAAPGGPGAPGTSTTVAGNLAFQSGAIYLVQVNATTSTLAKVTGTATLRPRRNVLAAFSAGTYLQKQYTILQSAGLNSTT